MEAWFCYSDPDQINLFSLPIFMMIRIQGEELLRIHTAADHTVKCTVLYIRIVSMRIRIQQFLSMRIRIQIQIQGFDSMTKKWKKFTVEKKLILFEQKLQFTYP